jgi:hypothetical protein
MAFRDIASSTNERTGIFCMLPAGVVFGNTAPCERELQQRPHSTALILQACLNSFSFDWTLRQKSAAHVNLFILDGCPLPTISHFTTQTSRFLVHAALRLTCNHAGYEPLWYEQLGDAWREPKAPFAWPVLEGDDERWAVRAAIDAVVADAYGLSREQYAHVLSSFSHRSYPKAPELCLARYDELQGIGLEAFTRKYDPYWDIPLNENLPEPVIELPIMEAISEAKAYTTAQQEQLSWLAAEPEAGWNLPQTSRSPSSFSRASVPNQTLKTRTDDATYERVKLLLKEQGVITSNDAQVFANLDAASARNMLKHLIEEGIAMQEGRGRGTKYRYVRHDRPTEDSL